MPNERTLKQVDDNVTRDKEPFDYEKFVKLYLHDTGDCQQLTGDEDEDVREEYEMRYDWHPEIKTVAEFADFLNSIDETS